MNLTPKRAPVNGSVRSETIKPGFRIKWEHWKLTPVSGPEWQPPMQNEQLAIPTEGADLPTTADYTGEIL